MGYIIFAGLGIAATIGQFFLEKGFLKRILIVIIVISLAGLGYLGYSDHSSSNRFQKELQSAVASSTVLQELVTKLQKQIPIPQENELYDPSGQIVAQVPPGEWPSSQSDLRGYNEFEFMELCNVTEIQPDEIITAYPFGKAINMTLYGTSTISSGGGISFFTGGNGSYTCSSPAGNVKFLLVQ